MTQLIARRVRELNLYCEVHPYHHFELTEKVDAVILSGSPVSVKDEDAPRFDLKKVLNHAPVMAIDYGAGYLVEEFGGSCHTTSDHRFDTTSLELKSSETDPILEDIVRNSQLWMSEQSEITNLPEYFEKTADTSDGRTAIFKGRADKFAHPVYGFLFHPEGNNTEQGGQFFKNFLVRILKLEQDWTPARFIDDTIHSLRSQIGKDQVVLGLSGGVDSSVAAALLHRAIGDRLICIFVDNGLLRKGEFDQVLKDYKEMGLHIIGARAAEEFYAALAGVSEPEQKRKAIGKVFIDVFEREARKLPGVKWLGQGTIYPDVIESVSVKGSGVTVKSHHNVGGLPEKLHLQIVEPLRMLFKDEVRKVGAELSIPGTILSRHPFPGPGLGIRILGEITPEKVRILQEADHIYISHLRESGWYDKIWQAAAILLPVRTVGVSGNERTYERTLALRAVNSIDGMTANWVEIPFDLLGKISNEIINKVKGINRVVYDISNKPPATIEWE